VGADREPELSQTSFTVQSVGAVNSPRVGSHCRFRNRGTEYASEILYKVDER
jgi:hypothetical protein